ncbi:MAG: Lacal_2735 family protein [Wenzhouxiangella sp.]|nr:Lacal_2735 family protein [Wenzhouxiangella sp.]MCH8476467.1 DUF6435 family protein [Wenzhouxiangella sp.]TVR93307.1 MAG: Lacal_2735 family protein [Wenzhouxiangellaceae bacterium]
MFGFLKSDPVKKLRKQYDAKLTQAQQAQRNGDIKGFAELSAEADAIWQQLQPLEQAQRQG